MNETRNILLILSNLLQAEDEKDKKFQTEWLLERYELEIKSQIKDLEYKKKELEEALETLEYVKRQEKENK